MSTVRLRRLTADASRLQEYVKAHPRLRMIQTQGDPPERYQIEYRIKCLRQVEDDLQIVKTHIVEIYLPRNYPRTPPQCRMLSPVFHPNIAPHAICVGDHWSAGESLFSIVTRIGEMLAYQSYNVKSPLNGEAARWVQEHEDELPLDKVSMLVDENKSTFTEDAAAPIATAPAPPTAAAPPPIPTPIAAPENTATDQPEFDDYQEYEEEFTEAVEPSAEAASDFMEDAFVDANDVFEPADPQPSFQPPPPPPPRPVARAPRTIPSDEIIRVKCPSCEKKSKVPASAIGRKAKCLRCETTFRITAGVE